MIVDVVCDNAPLPALTSIQCSWVFLLVLVSGIVLHWYSFPDSEGNITTCHQYTSPQFVQRSIQEGKKESIEAPNTVNKCV